jgi:hypothetical protein
MHHFIMLKKIRSAIILLTVLLFMIPSPLPGQRIDGKIIRTISFEWLEGCETGKGDCNPVSISRQHITDTIQLVFPVGGTSSSAYLYAGNSMTKPIRQDHKGTGQGPPFFYLTGLPDGKYLAHMLSCGVGGFFSIIIKTN